MTMSNEEAIAHAELMQAWKELDEERCPTCGCVESGCHEVGCLSDEWEDGE